MSLEQIHRWTHNITYHLFSQTRYSPIAAHVLSGKRSLATLTVSVMSPETVACAIQ